MTLTDAVAQYREIHQNGLPLEVVAALARRFVAAGHEYLHALLCVEQRSIRNAIRKEEVTTLISAILAEHGRDLI
jgi:hypothetical protein